MSPRTLFTLTLALGILTAPLAADAQPPAKKIPRVGFLSSYPVLSPFQDGFRRALGEMGYVEGQTLAIEWRWAEGKVERLPELAADLVRLKVDVIVATTNPEIAAAKQATAAIPIVMLAGVDPVGAGLIESLARPGGNVTGTAFHTPEVAGKILEVLRDAIPKITRVALIVNPDFPGMAAYAKETEAVARALGITIQWVKVRQPGDFDSAFVKIGKARPGALYVVGDPVVSSRQARIVEFAARNRLPAIYTSRRFVDAGGLMSYGANSGDLLRRNAAYIDRILKGAKPADLPVEQPTRFELVINMKTAKALGLTIPQSVLIRADQVIQ